MENTVESTKDKVCRIICNSLKLKDEKKDNLCDETNLITDLGADSLDFVEVVMALEEEFGIEVSDTDAENLKILSDIVNHIESAIEKVPV